MYIQLALIGDVDSLTDTGKEYMIIAIPGFTAAPGNVETILIESSGQIAGELIDQAAQVPPEALAAIGTTIYNIPMHGGARAVSQGTVTFADSTPPGTVAIDSMVSVPNPDGNAYIFTTDRDAISPVGGGDVAVNLIALDPGSAQNNSFGDCTLIDQIEGVLSIQAFGAQSGVDPETASEYLDRLTRELGILAPRPIIPEDHAVMAMSVDGVGRATALNLYYPGTTARDTGFAVGDFDLWTPAPPPTNPLTGQPRCTTVVITQADGSAPDSTLMNRVYQLLTDNREVNFLNFVLKPTYTSVDVKAVVTPYPDFVKQDAIDASTATVQEWLSPQGWGITPGASDVWAFDTKVRLYEAVDYINRGLATWYCEQVFLKLSSQPDNAWVAADITLPGVAPIPTYGQVLLT